jgi:hypothetical protein
MCRREQIAAIIVGAHPSEFDPSTIGAASRSDWVAALRKADEIDALPTNKEAPAATGAGEWRGDVRITRDLLCDVSHWLGEYIGGLADDEAESAERAQDVRSQVELRIDNLDFSLRAQPQAREEAQPVADVARIVACHLPISDCPDTVCLPITMTAGDLRAVYATLAAPPTQPLAEGADAEKLRVAVEALEYVKSETVDFAEAWEIAEVCDERLAAMQQEGAISQSKTPAAS